MSKKMTACILALVLLISLLPAGGLVSAVAGTTKTLTGGLAGTTTVVPVTDHAQTDALGDSLIKGKTLKAINTSGVMGAAVVAPNSGTKRRNKENAANVSVLTDGDYYTQSELKFAKKDSEFLAAPYGGTDWARSTAYQRVTSFYPDMAGLWVDMGASYVVDKVFVASGVQLTDVALADAQAMDAATLAAAEQSYVATTYVRNLQVYISDEQDTLFNAENQVFVYTNTADLNTWNWANIYELGTPVSGRYIGFKDSNFQTGDGYQGFVDHMAEIACYAVAEPTTKTLTGGLAGTTTVVPVTDHAQTDALGDSLIKGKTLKAINTSGVMGAAAVASNSGTKRRNKENAANVSVLTDGDYYTQSELKFAKKDSEFLAAPYGGTDWARSTAYQRVTSFYSDMAGLWVDMGASYVVDKVFVASGVQLTDVSLADAQAMDAATLAAAEQSYVATTYVRNLQVYISDEQDTLFNAENQVFVYTNTTDLNTWNWANLYELETAVTGRYIGFKDSNFQTGDGNQGMVDHMAEIACYGEKANPLTSQGAQVRNPEETDKHALRFVFTAENNGIVYKQADPKATMDYSGDLSNATVRVNGAEYKLVSMGAVVSIDPNNSQGLTLDMVDNVSTKDVPAVNLYEVADGLVTYTAVVVGISAQHSDTPIYAVPYIIYETENGTEAVYGDMLTKTVTDVLMNSAF